MAQGYCIVAYCARQLSHLATSTVALANVLDISHSTHVHAAVDQKLKILQPALFCFMDQWLSHLVTDNGPCFVSEEYELFLVKNGVEHITSAPYHPATNGLAKTVKRTKDTQGSLKTTCQDSHDLSIETTEHHRYVTNSIITRKTNLNTLRLACPEHIVRTFLSTIMQYWTVESLGITAI